MVHRVGGAQVRQWAASRREVRHRRSRRHNPTGKMALLDHLHELRHRLGVALLTLFLGGVAGFLWFQYRVGPVPSLGSLLTEPYCALDPKLRINLNGTSECRLLQTQPFEAFLVRLKVGLAAGAVVTGPVWLYQIWAFITPALRRKEQRLTRVFVTCAATFFALGAALAYLIVPLALRTLVSFGGGQFITALAGNDYVSFVLSMLIIFGISFEFPLLVVMLNRVGVLPYEKLRRWRRGLIFGVFVFAAIVTPSDPFSMIGLAVALTLLLELAIQLTKLHDRRKAANDSGEDAASAEDPPSLTAMPEYPATDESIRAFDEALRQWSENSPEASWFKRDRDV